MSLTNQNIIGGAGGNQGGYTIERSVRLRSSASAYFNRTPSVAGNRKTWTWSGWVKRGNLGAIQYIASAYYATSSGRYNLIRFDSTNALNVWTNAYNISSSATQQNTTSAVFRDVGAWYHIVVSLDTTEATASDRLKIYVNGVSQSYTGNTISLNQDTFWNGTDSTHRIGEFSSSYLDGYLTEVNFIDGQALTPNSFGEYDSITGVWKPAKYTGTYGTNGFYLDFSDNTTTTTLAEDKSGNGNDWAANNISLTSGVTYDSMTDTPTIYAGGGNYAVLNPLSKGTSQTNVIDGNLYAIPTSGGSNWGTVFSSIAIPTSGKWYMEATAQVYAGSGNSASFGVVDSASFIPTNTTTLYNYTTGEGFDGILAQLFSNYVSPIADGVQGTNVTGLTGTSIDLMLALDVDNGKVYAGYNGTWLNSGNPAGNTGEVATRTFSSSDVVAGHTSWNGTNDQSQYYNFGQRPFTYTPPDGFKELHTGNLPEPEIVDGSQYFNTVLYTGDGTTSHAITGVGFQPDFVWGKTRSDAVNHALYDSVRGATLQLSSADTDAETTVSNGLTSFNSDGFSLGDGTRLNTSGRTYVAWNWKANGAGVSNTDGSITSTVSANTTAGFSIVTYTGTGSAATVGHGLGVAPDMVICKNRDASPKDWRSYHTSLGNAQAVNLNQTLASFASTTSWNSTTPTSVVFSIGTASTVNDSGNNHIAYCFAEVEGYSKFGSYTGNGSDDGTFVYLGFRPAFIMTKQTNSSNNWTVIDTTRSPYNIPDNNIQANTSSAEFTNTRYDILSNGIKMRRGTSGDTNTSGGTYIYMAFAENPFKHSLAR